MAVYCREKNVWIEAILDFQVLDVRFLCDSQVKARIWYDLKCVRSRIKPPRFAGRWYYYKQTLKDLQIIKIIVSSVNLP